MNDGGKLKQGGEIEIYFGGCDRLFRAYELSEVVGLRCAHLQNVVAAGRCLYIVV
jgi:hypothetical protein